MRGAFITGTDTGVGKTRATRLLLEWLAQNGTQAAGFKPLACGDRDDAQELLGASCPDLPLDLDSVNPAVYASPVAPLVAARIEGQTVSTPDLVTELAGTWERIGEPTSLVEGVGGWEVPLADSGHQADLVTGLGLPILLVIDNRLGALNHAVLTVNAIRQRGLEVSGIVLNHIADSLDLASITNKSVIPELTGVPILAEILHDDSALTAEPELEQFFA